jgi:hypothetical protein
LALGSIHIRIDIDAALVASEENELRNLPYGIILFVYIWNLRISLKLEILVKKAKIN